MPPEAWLMGPPPLIGRQIVLPPRRLVGKVVFLAHLVDILLCRAGGDWKYVLFGYPPAAIPNTYVAAKAAALGPAGALLCLLDATLALWALCAPLIINPAVDRKSSAAPFERGARGSRASFRTNAYGRRARSVPRGAQDLHLGEGDLLPCDSGQSSFRCVDGPKRIARGTFVALIFCRRNKR
jgi:hypothetical protein